jgi:hypothetical protein
MTPKQFTAKVSKLRPGDLIMITESNTTILAIYSDHSAVHLSCTWTAEPHRDFTSRSIHIHCENILSIKVLKRGAYSP